MTPARMARLDELRQKNNRHGVTGAELVELEQLEAEASRLEFMKPDTDNSGGLVRSPSDQAQLDRETREEVREVAEDIGRGFLFALAEFVKGLFRR